MEADSGASARASALRCPGTSWSRTPTHRPRRGERQPPLGPGAAPAPGLVGAACALGHLEVPQGVPQVEFCDLSAWPVVCGEQRDTAEDKPASLRERMGWNFTGSWWLDSGHLSASGGKRVLALVKYSVVF